MLFSQSISILMRCIRFEDRSKRKQNLNGSWEHKLVHIQQVFNDFTNNMKKAYNPGQYLTVDEILLCFRGRCSFRMFIPSKRAKFGIKTFCLANPETMYLSNAEIYLGKQGQPDTGLGETVVLNLSTPFLRSGRTLVTDNFFTSSQLGIKLWENKAFLLGSVHKNRNGNPKDFIKEPLQAGKVQFAFRQQETLMKFQAKQTKQVCLYSTADHDCQIHRSGKLKIITDYNKTKFAVDIFDEMINRYSYRPPVNRWPLRIFMNFLVDGGAANAYVLYQGNTTRREFIHKLSDQLMNGQKAEKASSQHWMTKSFLRISNSTTKCLLLPSKNLGSAIYAKEQKEETVFVAVRKCEKPACEEHIVMPVLCTNCSRFEKEVPLQKTTVNGYCHVCQKGTKWLRNRCKKHFCKTHESKSYKDRCSLCR